MGLPNGMQISCKRPPNKLSFLSAPPEHCPAGSPTRFALVGCICGLGSRRAALSTPRLGPPPQLGLSRR